jgi:hypothetical protein
MTIQTPPVWDSSCYIRPIALQTSGASAVTHLAQLCAPDGKLCRGYVKHFYQHSPQGLFNEWFGHTLLSALGIPQPPAAVMCGPMYDNLAPLAWAFVSCEPTPRFDGTPKEIYNLAIIGQYKHLVARLFACASLPALVAADQLAINADRNIGNIVFTGDNSFVAIDHMDILGGSCWTAHSLQAPPAWVESKLIERLVTPVQLSPAMRNTVYAAAQVVQEQYKAIDLAFKEALKYSDGNDVATAIDAIALRCDPMTDWFKEKLNLLT